MKDTYYDLMRWRGISRRGFLEFNGIRMFKREPEAQSPTRPCP